MTELPSGLKYADVSGGLRSIGGWTQDGPFNVAGLEDIYIYMYVCIFAYIYIHTSLKNIYIYIYTIICIYNIYIYIYIHIYYIHIQDGPLADFSVG